MVSEVVVESRLTVDEVVPLPLPDDEDEDDFEEEEEEEEDDEEDEDEVEHEEVDDDDDRHLELVVSAVVHGTSATAEDALLPPPTVGGDDRWSVRHGTIVILAKPADTLWWLALWLL